jgi:hypothetical protein
MSGTNDLGTLAIVSDGTVHQRPRRIVVFLGALRNIKQALRELSDLPNIERLGDGVYFIHGTKQLPTDILKDAAYIVFKRVNDIPRIRKGAKESEKTFTLIHYRFNSPTAKQKKTAERLRMRTPSIRLRPGVLLFPHLRFKDDRYFFSKESGSTSMNSKMFVEHIVELGASVNRWTKLRPMTQSNREILRIIAQTTFEKRAESLEVRIQSLISEARARSLPLKELKRRLSILFRILKSMKSNQELIQLVWGFDSERIHARLYNLLLSARRIINDIES